jgi:hypothetical protein
MEKGTFSVSRNLRLRRHRFVKHRQARFRFPIAVLLFNKPEETEVVLQSLCNQDLEVDPSRLFISIDGFSGSKNEYAGDQDRTQEVFEIAQKLLPNATIFRQNKNLGIAQQFALLEQICFDLPKSDWVFFQEDDFELGQNYLRIIAELIAFLGDVDEVVTLAATGDSLVLELNSELPFRPLNHHWSYALRRSHAEERSTLHNSYLDSVKDDSYFKRDNEKIKELMAQLDVFPIGSSQDYVKHALRIHYRKLAVTTTSRFGKYIGRRGENFTEDLYERMGYGHQEIEHFFRVPSSRLSSRDIADMFWMDRLAYDRELFSVWSQ